MQRIHWIPSLPMGGIFFALPTYCRAESVPGLIREGDPLPIHNEFSFILMLFAVALAIFVVPGLSVLALIRRRIGEARLALRDHVLFWGLDCLFLGLFCLLTAVVFILPFSSAYATATSQALVAMAATLRLLLVMVLAPLSAGLVVRRRVIKRHRIVVPPGWTRRVLMIAIAGCVAGSGAFGFTVGKIVHDSCRHLCPELEREFGIRQSQLSFKATPRGDLYVSVEALAETRDAGEAERLANRILDRLDKLSDDARSDLAGAETVTITLRDKTSRSGSWSRKYPQRVDRSRPVRKN